MFLYLCCICSLQISSGVTQSELTHADDNNKEAGRQVTDAITTDSLSELTAQTEKTQHTQTPDNSHHFFDKLQQLFQVCRNMSFF